MEGRLAVKEEIVQKSFVENMDVDLIAKITGLSVELILEI